MVTWDGNFLRKTRFTTYVRQGLKRIAGGLINIETVVLPPELTKTYFDMYAKTRVVQIPTDRIDKMYLVHYGVARVG